MRRERILVAIDGMEIGGSQRQVEQLLKGLDRQRWEPELVFFRCPSFLVDEIARQGIRVHHLPKRRRVDIPFLFALARLLRRGNYALVHAFSLTAELACVLARPLSGRWPALVASERSFALDRPPWFWRLKRLVLGQSAAVIANSRAGARATARRTRMPDELFYTVSNGVDIPAPLDAATRASLRASVGVSGDRLLALFVGRLVPVKNLPSLIRAMALLEPAQRPWLVLVGDGPERDEIQALADASGVSGDLCFLGERRDVDRLLQAADYLVLPSHFEGLSNAILEAMAAGCPVIASAVGGSPELVENGHTGLLYPPDDATALAEAMRRMADPALRQRLSLGASRHIASHHSQAALGIATASVYERCLQRTVAPDAPAPADPLRGSAK
jgi:glycosyltransferase involved in cell wall biosynthesis